MKPAPEKALRALAVQYAGRADDCGRLARMVLEVVLAPAEVAAPCTSYAQSMDSDLCEKCGRSWREH